MVDKQEAGELHRVLTGEQFYKPAAISIQNYEYLGTGPQFGADGLKIPLQGSDGKERTAQVMKEARCSLHHPLQ